MSDHGRASRLRTLIRELERSAPSEERDAILHQARDRLSALELAWDEPSAWPAHGHGLSFPPMGPPPRQQVVVELTDVVLD